MSSEAYSTLPKGARVLVIEDESLVTMLIEDALADVGCEIAGIGSNLNEGVELAASLEFDVAILDVNLNGRQTYPIAKTLLERGIPFVFATGYGVAGVSDEFDAVPVLTKPFHQDDLARALAEALG